jgi:cbb3-type cytochrome oxidase cytochrome c subunit
VDLPAEAGNFTEARYEPNEQWLQQAGAEFQKAALWRWFATHLEDPRDAVPHSEQDDDYLWGDDEPVLADQALNERFGSLVPTAVLREVLTAIRSEVGNEWAHKRLDKAGA